MVTYDKRLLECAVDMELQRRLHQQYSDIDSKEERQIEFVRVVEPDDRHFLECAVDLYTQSLICGGPLKIPIRVEEYYEAKEGEIDTDLVLARRLN